MSSKSPVRSCEDVDETALSYAEIKALCAGNPLIKEKMDLDIDVARLRLLKADHQSQHYRLEDSLLKQYPQAIETVKESIKGLEHDIARLAEYTHNDQDAFPVMEINGIKYFEKDKAGAAILTACSEIKTTGQAMIGEWRGFNMYLSFDSMFKQYKMTLKSHMSHPTDLGQDVFGNITRINNALNDMPTRLKSANEYLNNLYQQVENAKAELEKPFQFEAELNEKSERLAYLDSQLNMDEHDNELPSEDMAAKRENVVAKGKPSILENLRANSSIGKQSSVKAKDPDMSI